jgi:glycosyltransferase 2 family protein
MRVKIGGDPALAIRDKFSTSSLLRTLGTLASVGLLAYLLHKQGWHDIGKAFARIPWWAVAVAGVLMMVSRLATVARWHVLLRALGIEIPLRRSAAITFAGLFSSNFLPSTVGGDVARLAAAMQLGYGGAQCAASLILDRLIGMLGMLTALPLGIPAFHRVLTLDSGGRAWTAPVAALSPVGKIRGAFSRTFSALAQCAARPYHLLGALCFTWVHMLSLFALLGLLLSVMGEPLPLATIAGLWTMVYFATLVPISINGLGLQELSITYVFTHAGVSTSAALAVALVVRTLTMLASVPGAAFVPTIMSGNKAQRDPAILSQSKE